MLTENGTATTFLHDGDEEIADYASATVLRRYVPGPRTDMPIAMVTPSGGSNTRKYFHANRQGSTIAMSADNGTLAEGPYTYDANGNGAPPTGVPFKYTGRRLDPGTGLYYYRARYYSAALSRFLQVDPVGYGPDMNYYTYVSNDPLNSADPSGLTDINFYTQANESPRWRAIGAGFDIPGMFTVGGHGTKPGQGGMPNPNVGPRSAANLDPYDLSEIINKGAPPASPVFLLTCNFGRDPVYPATLSTATNRTIWAPDKYTWVDGDPNGAMTIVVADAINNDPKQGMDSSRMGSWREFSGGSATGREITKLTYNAKTGQGSYTIKGDRRSIFQRWDRTVKFKCSGSGSQRTCS